MDRPLRSLEIFARMCPSRNIDTLLRIAIAICGLGCGVLPVQAQKVGSADALDLVTFVHRGPAAALSATATFEYEFTKKTSQIKQPPGNAPAGTTKLPEFKGPYSVRVIVFAKGIKKIGIVVPTVTLFDENYVMTKGYDAEDTLFYSPWSGTVQTYEVHAEKTVSVADTRSAFLLLSTDTGKVGQQVQYVQRYTLGRSTSTSGYKIYRGIEGKVRIQILDSVDGAPEKTTPQRRR